MFVVGMGKKQMVEPWLCEFEVYFSFSKEK